MFRKRSAMSLRASDTAYDESQRYFGVLDETDMNRIPNSNLHGDKLIVVH